MDDVAYRGGFEDACDRFSKWSGSERNVGDDTKNEPLAFVISLREAQP
jgi:hypothetical protein